MLLLELLLMLMLDGQFALTMSTFVTLIVPIGVAELTPLVELPLRPAPLAMLDWSCEVELLPRLPLLLAEPLTPPVLLALVVGAEPLCGNEPALLELDGEVLALAVVSVLELVLEEPRLPLALPAGVEALADVEGELEVELLLPSEPLEEDPRLALVVSAVPWIFT